MISRSLVLLTRPYDDSLSTAHKLAEFGYSCLIDPMLNVDYYTREHIQFKNPMKLQACILTSQRAVKALAMLAISQSVPIFVVGPGTAAAVRQQGYKVVIQGHGDGAGLLPELYRWLQPNKGTIVYFSGEETRFDFVSHLSINGYDIQRYLVYRTLETAHLQVETIDALQHNKIAVILYYSPKSARRFNELALSLDYLLKDVKAICLSSAVAAELTLPFADKVVASQPHEQAMIAVLKNRIKI